MAKQTESTFQPGGAVAPEALERSRRYRARCDDLSATAGILNCAHAHLVEVAIDALADGDHVGPGLHSFAQFLAWRSGVSMTTARAVERIARRADELPVLWAALRAGEISLDQAAVVARYVPARYDESATTVAKVMTVTQLRSVLPAYADPPKGRRRSGSSVSVTDLDDGTSQIRGELDPDQAALVRKALDAMREDLWRQRREDADAVAAETGTPVASVEAPTGAEALAAMAETSLAAGEARHPGSERYLVSYHLQAGPDGRVLLLDDRGHVAPEAERLRILCDHRFEAVLHGPDRTPLSVGRATRHINRKLRRAVLHRDRFCCTVPGCTARHGLEIHHIIHWEHGGPTDTSNLTTQCRHHHRAHHHGELHIEGNPDLPSGTPGALQIGPPGRPLPSTGTHPPPPPHPHGNIGPVDHLRDALTNHSGTQPPDRASTPTGERLNRSQFHLNPAPQPKREPGSSRGRPPPGPAPPAF